MIVATFERPIVAKWKHPLPHKAVQILTSTDSLACHPIRNPKQANISYFEVDLKVLFVETLDPNPHRPSYLML